MLVAGPRLQPFETRVLEAHVVVGVEVVVAQDLVAAIEQAVRQRRADEARGAGDQDLHWPPPEGRSQAAVHRVARQHLLDVEEHAAGLAEAADAARRPTARNSRCETARITAS